MKNLLKIIIIFVFVFYYPPVSFARKLDKFTVGGHDAVDLSFIEVHEEDLIEVKKKIWEELSNRSVAVEGRIFPSTGISKVRYSLNGGIGYIRAEGEDPFYFTFVPLDGTTYPVVIKCFDRREEVVFTKKINIKFFAIDWDKFFKDKVEEVRRTYEDGEVNTLMNFINELEYPYRDKFEQNLSRTFEENDLIMLSITVNSVELSSDKASIDVDWRKTFADDSYQEGESTILKFVEGEKGWEIVSISDEEIFVVGSGTLFFVY
ncbi:hypothetical protein ACFL2J_03490 [Candidatus Omnitrophota bacterium]